MKTSFTEENYLKAIFKLEENSSSKTISTNDISNKLFTQPATVTDMIKKLADKKLVSYKKYHGVTLTDNGNKIALDIIRKHRLWEVFLVKKLQFKWDEVHEIAEQLEHVDSELLISKLDDFLGNPKFDPHGDAIPDKKGKMQNLNAVPLNTITKKQSLVFCGVINHDPKFLQHLTHIKLNIGNVISIEEINAFDSSFKIMIDKKYPEFLSEIVASSILVYPKNDK